MRIAQVKVHNFRGILDGLVQLDGHSVLVGDNNAGKSTLLEAIDLVLGPERLSRRPVIDEHDFYAGHYLGQDSTPIPIWVEVIVADLTDEQRRHFREHIEWWDCNAKALLAGPPPEGTDQPHVGPALRVFFKGLYDAEEDDFTGNTYFAIPQLPTGDFVGFRPSDKRLCGFLFLRTLRTGSRALSLERGSLLDIILRLQDTRLKMWEDLLKALRQVQVAEKPELGIVSLLASVQEAVRQFVPSDWAESPHMRVSDLTRETLRRTLTVFMGTGATLPDGSHFSAPFQHQGTGTINTLVLALLTIIAELKQNVIFAMEEPEIALPPHTQKRIVNSVRSKSAQAIFTSHSPYVLEEFKPSEVRVLRRKDGVLRETPATYPPTIKPKAYKAEFRARFCEALLAKYVLIVEGRTEFDAMPAAARRLHELQPEHFKTLEALGVAIINAQSDSQVAPLGKFFREMGKTVFAVFDKQNSAQLALIIAAVDHPFESPTQSFEELVICHTKEVALRRYAATLVADGEWPQHLMQKTPGPATTLTDLQSALYEYFAWSKGSGDAGDLVGSCTTEEMPVYIPDTLYKIAQIVEPPPPPPPPPGPTSPIPPAPGVPSPPSDPAGPASGAYSAVVPQTGQ
ncbi:ATP-dependent nuclease [Ralstonia pickettii]|uniref:ATP-dependent nuclease n=1 Tax=Ralstonia pickettii TaxID=329 RepID=UPI00081889B1|nr:AAA family ATPase [Ralstonia pickettii]OCS48532.1 ATP-dependent endonuclease [Ralstonia pickettii]